MSRDTDVFKKHDCNLCSQGAQTGEMCTLSAQQSIMCPSGPGDGPWLTTVVQLPVMLPFFTSPAPDLSQSQQSVEKCLQATFPSALPSGTGWKLRCEMGLTQNVRKTGQVCSESSPCTSRGDLHSVPGKQYFWKLLLKAGHVPDKLHPLSREP